MHYSPEQYLELQNYLKSFVPSCGLPFYASIDVRDSGHKCAAVDVNLFPAGFNNLDEQAQILAAHKIKQFFSSRLLSTPPWKIALWPESHTNNQGYLLNLQALIKILTLAGCQVNLLWSGPAIPKPWTLKIHNGDSLTYLPFEQGLQDAQALVLNHDLSSGFPPLLETLNIPVFPSPQMGWWKRKKSQHHLHIQQLLLHLHSKFDWFDCHYFHAQTQLIDNPELHTEQGIENLAATVEVFFNDLYTEYQKRHLKRSPVIFLKNDSGTYGLGVLSFHSAQEIRNSSQVIRKNFRVGKQSVPVKSLILQEGIPTVFRDTTFSDIGQPNPSWAAEPTLYLAAGVCVGGFFRHHQKISNFADISNLNIPGSQFFSFASSQAQEFFELSQWCQGYGWNNPTYDFLAKLHMVGAALEACPPNEGT